MRILRASHLPFFVATLPVLALALNAIWQRLGGRKGRRRLVLVGAVFRQHTALVLVGGLAMKHLGRKLVTPFAAMLALAGCSYIPLVGSDDGRITNPAVAACMSAADHEGLDAMGERQATPSGEGRYTVVLEVRSRAGYTQVTCNYDPASGAKIEKPGGAKP